MHRFIHIPKNGGSAVTTWLQQNNIEFLLGTPGKNVGKHKKAINWQNEPSIKFCIVRHPYTRTISYFNYIASTESWTSFEQFVKNKWNPVVFKIPTAWDLQSQWILDGQGCVLCEKIFHYENIQAELSEYFGCNEPLPKINQTNTQSVTMSELTDQLKQIIYNHHQQDFERFGYLP